MTFFDVELADPLINSRNLMENQRKATDNPDKLNLTVNSENEENFHMSLMDGTHNLEELGSKIRFGDKK